MFIHQINGNYDNYLSMMLERTPTLFLHFARQVENEPEVIAWIQGKCKSKRNYYSPVLHQILMLTGKLSHETVFTEAEAQAQAQAAIFGINNPEGMSEDLAEVILDQIIQYIDPKDTDYYGDDIVAKINRNKESILCRTGNDKIVNYICSYFNLQI